MDINSTIEFKTIQIILVTVYFRWRNEKKTELKNKITRNQAKYIELAI